MTKENKKFMVDFLNSNRSRKIEILKSEISSVNGMKQSELNFTINKVTEHFQTSLARDFNLQEFQSSDSGNPIKRNPNTLINLNRPQHQNFIVR